MNFKKFSIKDFLLKYMMAMLLVLIIITMSVLRPEFLSGENILNILRQISVNAILAFGMTFVIITGGIDLSVGSLLAVSGVFAAGLIKNGAGILPACAIGILAAGLLGFLNGLTISKLKVPPFVITLAMMTIGRGIAYVHTDGRPIVDLNESFLVLGRGKFLDVIPWPIIVMLLVMGIMALLLYKTKYGRYVYALGGNEDAARVSGIKINKIKTIVYTVNGLLAGLAGIVLASRINSGQPQAGVSYELDAIAAVVIGGTSLSGGVGTIHGTLLGALIIGVINNSLNLLGVNQYYQMIIKGLVIAFAVIVDVASTKKNK
jgi:ribose/xylose/arabinose/galactoside ABC-type transport system permease subunit